MSNVRQYQIGKETIFSIQSSLDSCQDAVSSSGGQVMGTNECFNHEHYAVDGCVGCPYTDDCPSSEE
jgi:hypothetical protein